MSDEPFTLEEYKEEKFRVLRIIDQLRISIARNTRSRSELEELVKKYTEELLYIESMIRNLGRSEPIL